MLTSIIDWLSGVKRKPVSTGVKSPEHDTVKSSPAASPEAHSAACPPTVATSVLLEKTSTPDLTSLATRAPKGRQRRSTATTKPPIDLRIGLDVGTSCTKAVLGNPESGQETAIPIGSGGGLRDYMLRTRVFLGPDGFSLVQTPQAKAFLNLKLKLLEHSAHGRQPDREDLVPLVAFVALTLRRVREWHATTYTPNHPGRQATWWLSVGLPSKRVGDDVFSPTYTTVVRTAASLADTDRDIGMHEVVDALENADPETAWISQSRISFFPEAGAQLASLLFSPFCPEGCLLLVDVGAGTLDVSTLKVSSTATGANCFSHCSDVAPLGVHFLQIERQGLESAGHLDLGLEDVIEGFRANRKTDAEERFSNRCRETLLATVARYRKALKSVHTSPNYRPWKNGLVYVLSGGGHRDEFYQELLQVRLREWLRPLVSEWSDEYIGLRREKFTAPPSFGPEHLVENFDRFSVAHGLCRGLEELVNTGNPK